LVTRRVKTKTVTGSEVMERQTINVQEAAAFIGVSKDLVYQLVRQKDIPHLKVGKRILFRKESLERWMNNQEVTSIQTNVKAATEYGALRPISL
jgi:excisionase family DNA binding protein